MFGISKAPFNPFWPTSPSRVSWYIWLVNGGDYSHLLTGDMILQVLSIPTWDPPSYIDPRQQKLRLPWHRTSEIGADGFYG